MSQLVMRSTSTVAASSPTNLSRLTSIFLPLSCKERSNKPSPYSKLAGGHTNETSHLCSNLKRQRRRRIQEAKFTTLGRCAGHHSIPWRRGGKKSRACRSLYLNTFVQLSNAPLCVFIWRLGRYLQRVGRQASHGRTKTRQLGRQGSWQPSEAAVLNVYVAVICIKGGGSIPF
jgi:hypothetical protein